MHEENPERDGAWTGPIVTRRTALGYTGAIATAVWLTGCDLDELQPEIEGEATFSGPHTFSFVHDPSVGVFVTQNEDRSKFDLSIRLDGSEVERFAGLDARSVERLESEYVEVRLVPIPGMTTSRHGGKR